MVNIVLDRAPFLTIEPEPVATQDVHICEGCGVRPATNGPLCVECALAECAAKIAGVLGVLDDW